MSKVNDEIITTLWTAGVTPVVSPIAVDELGGLLNCNADTAAGALAGALEADELVLLSDVDQLRGTFDDVASAMTSVSGEQVAALPSSNDVRDGMRPKIGGGARRDLGAGARRVLVANGTRRHALRDALSGDVPTTEVFRDPTLHRPLTSSAPGDLSTILERSCSAFDDETLDGPGRRPGLRATEPAHARLELLRRARVGRLRDVLR